jgi:predicted GIY-YIG superfamily endonuclease
MLTCVPTGKSYVGQTKNLVARLRRHSAAPSITMAKHTASYRPFTTFFTVQVMAHANAKRTADAAEKRVTLAQGTLWPGGYNRLAGNPASSKQVYWITKLSGKFRRR